MPTFYTNTTAFSAVIGFGMSGAPQLGQFVSVPTSDVSPFRFGNAESEQTIWDELDRTAMTYAQRDELWKHFQSREV